MQVRDRATLHLAELDGKAGGLAAVKVQWNIPAKNLEKSLRAYLENGTDAPFDMVSAQLSCILRRGRRKSSMTQTHIIVKDGHAHTQMCLGNRLLKHISELLVSLGAAPWCISQLALAKPST